jgi:hypothetical protein
MASKPSGIKIKATMANKCAATHAFELIDATAPPTVDSSCQGRTAGYRKNKTPRCRERGGAEADEAA